MSTTGDTPEEVVRAWIRSVNAGDADATGAFVDDDVKIVGPRGTTQGREAVAGWVRHTGIRMQPVTVREDEQQRVVVDGTATWQLEGGQPGERTPDAPIVMAFTVEGGLITWIERLQDHPQALEP